ncbi:DNA repair protein rhp57, variant 2 [Basidiobolus ranarum]|uniref:DNA repair protein rhp57, variant 2 n=1 Tax=Basidiobolus ranarum TaxID=34480 RepID=A0ABR2W3M9_9FUNG
MLEPLFKVRSEVVYLVSEGRFPLKRLYQLIPHFQKKHPILKDKDLGSKIHIAHLADLETQHHLIHYHLPVLLSRHKIRLIILDSVAANFRAEDLLVDGEMKTSKNGFSIEKIRGLLQLGHQLHRLSVNFGIPVICVNQASALMRSEFDLVQTPEDSAIPALGLSWSNTLNTRIMLQRDRSEGLTSDNQRRSLRVLLSPYLSNGSCNFTIEEDGINGEDSGGHMS